MRKLLVLAFFGLLSTSLMAYSDSDMDGVDDKYDKCPNTPLMDLVDINGCTIQKLSTQKSIPVSNYHFDIIVGLNYTGSNYTTTPATDNYSSSFQVDYYYKDFSIQASTSYYTTDASDGYSDNGMNDTFVGTAYTLHPTQEFSIRLGAGILLPTYDTSLNNNNTDYLASVNVSYKLSKTNLFAGYIYTQINDDDVLVTLNDGSQYSIYYQDTNAYSIGVGYYFSPKLYLSTSYNQTQSIYKGTDDAKTAVVYAYYGIDKNWFVNFSYAYGINDVASDNALSLKLGYYF